MLFFHCILPIKKLSPSSNGYCQVISIAEENCKICIYERACSQYCMVSRELGSPKAETQIRRCHASPTCPPCWQLPEEDREAGIGSLLSSQGGSLQGGLVAYLQGCSLNHIESFLVFFQLGTTDIPTRPCPSAASMFPQHRRPTRQWRSIGGSSPSPPHM